MMILNMTLESNLFTKRGHKTVVRKLLRESMERHRDVKLPRHFDRNADTAPGGAYGYAKRTAKYQRRKAKRKGHQKPLVLSGRLKDHVLAQSRITATATRTRLYARSYFPMRVQMRKEIESISKLEQSEMRGLMGLKYLDAAKRPEFQEFRRRRIR